MVVAVTRSSKPRWECTLHSAETLADDLGFFGVAVGPRIAVTPEVRREEEDWCARRLFIALAAKQRLRFPVIVERGDPARKQPDYVIHATGEQPWGLEVTQAGRPKYHRWLTASAKSISAGQPAEPCRGGGLDGSKPDDLLVRDIAEALDRKWQRLAKGGYAGVSACELLIYVNSEANGFSGSISLAKTVAAALGNPPGRAFRALHLMGGDGGLVVLDVGTTRGPVDVDISRRCENDFAAWATEQAAAVQAGVARDIDRANVAEELEALARRDRRVVRSQLRILLQHALKWEYQPDRRSRSWLISINKARTRLLDVLADSPSLADPVKLQAELERIYPEVRRLTTLEMKASSSDLPAELALALTKLLDPDYPPSGNGQETAQ